MLNNLGGTWRQSLLALIHLVGGTRSSCSFILYRESDDGALTLLMKDFACVMSLSVEGRITCVCQHLSNWVAAIVYMYPEATLTPALKSLICLLFEKLKEVVILPSFGIPTCSVESKTKIEVRNCNIGIYSLPYLRLLLHPFNNNFCD